MCLSVHYEGRLQSNGEVFDSSRVDGAVFSFEVGKGKVIRAWDVAIKTMKVLCNNSMIITCSMGSSQSITVTKGDPAGIFSPCM